MLVILCLLWPSGQGTGAGERSAGVRGPVVVWPSGPLEVIAAFGAPVDPAFAKSLIGRKITYTDAPAMERGAARSSRSHRRLRIVGATLTDGGRTLVLATDPHPRPARYALPFRPAADAVYDLSGIDASWSEGDQRADRPGWSGWWPAFDSAFHEPDPRLRAAPGRALAALKARPADA